MAGKPLCHHGVRFRRANGSCRPCTNMAKSRYLASLPQPVKKDRNRAYDLKRAFGITPAQYATVFQSQNGCCAICSRPQSDFRRRLSVDHNHTTKQIRGLLCTNCNTSLATLEAKEFCAKASLYLAQWENHLARR